MPRLRPFQSGLGLADIMSIENTTDGIDYGIRPGIVLVPNLNLASLWMQAGFRGLSYLQAEPDGPYCGMPSIGLGFAQFDKALELFTAIRSWFPTPEQTREFQLTIVTNHPKAEEYTATIASDLDCYIERLLGPGGQRDYTPFAMVSFFKKTLPLGQYTRTFISYARGRATLVYPMSMMLDEKQQQSFITPLDSLGKRAVGAGFVKRDIHYFDIATIPKDTFQYKCLIATPRSTPDVKQLPPPPPPPSPSEVSIQRQRQLKRFFTVAQARIAANASFQKAKSRLVARYHDWQVMQAACTIAARKAWPELGERESPDMVGLYEALRSTLATAQGDKLLTIPFTPELLAAQVEADVSYLYLAVGQGQACDRLKTLRTLGYL